MERLSRSSLKAETWQSRVRRDRPAHTPAKIDARCTRAFPASAMLCLLAAGCAGGEPDTPQEPEREPEEEIGSTQQPLLLHQEQYAISQDCFLTAELRSESSPQGVFGQADTFAAGGGCVGAGASVATVLFDQWFNGESTGWLTGNRLLWAQAQQWGNPFGSHHWVDYTSGYCVHRFNFDLSPWGTWEVHTELYRSCSVSAP